VNWPDKMLSIIPEAEVLIALEPEELGLRMLPVLKSIPDCEGLTRQTFVSVISRPPLPGQRQAGGVYPAQFSKLIEEALVEAWTWLEGAALLVDHASHGGSYKSLSRRARKLADDPNPQRAFAARRFPKEALHPRIREDVWALYHRGKYDTAVFEAMREVEIAVREAAGFARGEHGDDPRAEPDGPAHVALQARPHAEGAPRRPAPRRPAPHAGRARRRNRSPARGLIFVAAAPALRLAPPRFARQWVLVRHAAAWRRRRAGRPRP